LVNQPKSSNNRYSEENDENNMAMTYQARRFQSLAPLREMQTRLRRSYDWVKQGSAQ